MSCRDAVAVFCWVWGSLHTVTPPAVLATPCTAAEDVGVVAVAGVRVGAGISAGAVVGAGDSQAVVDIRFAVSAGPSSNAGAGVGVVVTGIRARAPVRAGLIRTCIIRGSCGGAVRD